MRAASPPRVVRRLAGGGLVWGLLLLFAFVLVPVLMLVPANAGAAAGAADPGAVADAAATAAGTTAPGTATAATTEAATAKAATATATATAETTATATGAATATGTIRATTTTAPAPAVPATTTTTAATASCTSPRESGDETPWPAWAAFRRDTLSPDGRVIDASTPQQATVSEGQAYALFFALVANDRERFDKVLAWTEDHLAQGDLATHLPAWIWGRRAARPAEASASVGAQADAAAWGVLDTNPASDADLWIVYALLEAGRLWHERRYTALGTVMARNVVRRETASLPGLGRTVLPGPAGFQIDRDSWRLNPSYVPLQLMRRLALALPDQPEWKALLASSARLVNETAPRGFAPDWVVYRGKGGFEPDAQTQAESAYNAIRVYLWAGTLAPGDPLRAATLATFRPLAGFVAAHGFAPERVDTRTGAAGPNAGNAGFSAAVAPYLAALGRADLPSAQAARSRTLARETPPGYYSQVLMLFGLGYLDGRYRFDADGLVVPAWTSPCSAAR